MLKEDKHILWRTSASLLGIALPSLLVGRAVMAVCLALGILLGLFATKGNSLRSSVRLFLKAKTLRVGMFMLACLGVATAFAPQPAYAGVYLAQIAGMGLVAMLLYLVLREMPGRHVQLLLQAFFIALLVVMLFAVLDAMLDDPRLSLALHGRKADSADRLNYFGSILVVMLPFLWTWLIRRYNENEPLTRKLGLFVAVLGFFTVFISGGLAGWLALLVSAPVFLYYAQSLGEIQLKVRHWFLVVLAFACGPFVYAISRFLTGDTVEQVVQMLQRTATTHLQIWQFSLSHLPENIVTGIGLNSFRHLPMASSLPVATHPHNMLLQLLLETGLVGLVGALALFCWLLYIFWKFAKGNLFGAATFCALLAFFSASMLNISIIQPWWLVFFVFVTVLGGRIGWTGGK